MGLARLDAKEVMKNLSTLSTPLTPLIQAATACGLLEAVTIERRMKHGANLQLLNSAQFVALARKTFEVIVHGPGLEAD